MPERENEDNRPTDLLVIAPSTLDRFIKITTGNFHEDTPGVKIIKSENVFTDDMRLDLSISSQALIKSSMQGFISGIQQLACLGALAQIADSHYGKDNWREKRTVRMILASSFEIFINDERHGATRDAISSYGLKEELQAVVNQLKTEALIKGTEYEELIWQNPDTVPKQ